jgi:hypothetical protein
MPVVLFPKKRQETPFINLSSAAGEDSRFYTQNDYDYSESKTSIVKRHVKPERYIKSLVTPA